MTRRTTALVLFGATAALVQFAAAQVDPGVAFKVGDTNKDGKLSREEFLALVNKKGKLKDNPDLARQVFEKLDANKNGFLTLDEFRAFPGLAKGQPTEPPAKGSASAAGFNDRPTGEQLAFFEKKIRPALVEHCYKCHAADAEKVRGGLLLDTREGLRKGGDTGPVVVPGSPDRSPLIKAVRYRDEATKMPPKAKLPDEVIADLEAWVKMGAPDPRDGAKIATKEIDIEKGREFWAFQKPKKPTPPAVKGAAWPKSDIDRFLLAGLEAKGLRPVGDADKRTLIRRAYLDLTGLPPTPEEVEAFVADTSPTAFEKVVDKLLASPRFGERWGRHWLDVARYAETTGKTVNVNHPYAWRYRDYVIAAFNADKPYDQFIREQLAGDLMATNDPKAKAERIIATGFLAIGPKALNERNGIQFELDLADEQIDVTTQAFLGITAACARCHDHKFDPIPQKDYYALAGIFRSTETCYGTVRFVQSQRPTPLIPLPSESGVPAGTEKLTAAERKRIEGQIKELQERKVDQQVQRLLINGQIALQQARLDAYDADGNPKLLAMGVRDKPVGKGFGPFAGTRTILDSPVYTRGEVDKPGAVVPRGVLQVVTTSPPRVRSGSGRLELANWIASPDNPLTARVMVNRVWLHLFGRGIVPTPDNFGAAGQPPSNPQLLDHLAVTFAADGWSVKKLIRRVMLSHAYQLDSCADPRNLEADPDNALVWRMTPRRLDAEALRDAMLAVSGQLDLGPPVGSAVARAGEGPTQQGPRFGGGVQQAVNDPRNNIRSVYLPVVRDNLPEALSLFDAADPSLVVAERPVTTTPAQSLFLLNNPFVMRVSDAAAGKLLASTTTDTERVRAAYLTFYGRPPAEKELTAATDFLSAYKAAITKERVPTFRQERETWAAFCQALFASAEFQYRK
jgi:cytochrome c553